MNNDFTSTYEYTVEQKAEGKFRLMKIAFLALYILYPIIFMAVLFIIQLFQLFALVAVTEWMLVYFTWKYTKPEYEYSVTSGRVTFSVIRGGKTVAGNENKLYGDYRLVKYAYFLQKNYFAKHRSQRAQLGAWMLRMASSGGTVNAASDEKRKVIRPSERFATLRYTEA